MDENNVQKSEMKNLAIQEQKLVRKRQIARRYDVSERTIQEWAKQGKLPFHKIGYMVRFDPIECDRALERFVQRPRGR